MFNRGVTGSPIKLNFHVGTRSAISTTNVVSHTFTNVDIGDEHKYRMVAVAVQMHGTAGTVTGTINGITATTAISRYDSPVKTAIIYAPVPTGTLVSVVINSGGLGIFYAIVPYSFLTKAVVSLDAASASGGGGGTYTANNVECTDGGVVIGTCRIDGGSGLSSSWNGTDSAVNDFISTGTYINNHVLTTEASATNDLRFNAAGAGRVVVAATSFEFIK